MMIKAVSYMSPTVLNTPGHWSQQNGFSVVAINYNRDKEKAYKSAFYALFSHSVHRFFFTYHVCTKQRAKNCQKKREKSYEKSCSLISYFKE